jgi:hypothetical protein
MWYNLTCAKSGRVLGPRGGCFSSCAPFSRSTEILRRTFSPIGDKDKILQKLEDVAGELEEDMSSSGWTGRTVTLKYKLDTYQGKFAC